MSENRPQYWGDVMYEDDIYQRDYLYYIDTDFDDDGDVDALYGSEYDFNEDYYNSQIFKTAAPSNPRKYIDSYSKDEFLGSKWKPKKFIQLLYLRNMYNTAKSFIKELQEININKVPAKKTLNVYIKNARISLKKADRLYEIDQISCLSEILSAIEEGRKFVEKLKLYAIQKRI